MTRWIDMTDTQKAAIWKRELGKTDWNKVLSDIDAEIAQVEASNRRPGSKAAELRALDSQRRTALNSKQIAGQ